MAGPDGTNKPAIAELPAEALDERAQASWRANLKIHPAAEMFPPMSADELPALGADIIANGLTSSIVLWSDGEAPPLLLDGRNRLDAIEIATGSPAEIGAPSIMAGKDFLAINKVIVLDKSVDPYTFAVSANLHRRHLDTEGKRNVIANLIKAMPDKSDRSIAEMVKVDHKTVASVRAEMEGRGEIPHVETRTDSQGRNQPVKRTRNYTRGIIHRTLKLGAPAMAKIKGTSLDRAGEMDELIRLNRGSALGELTTEVAQLIEDAAAGKDVSAIAYTAEIMGQRPRPKLVVVAGTDVDAGAHEDKDARIKELQAEIEELRAEKSRLVDDLTLARGELREVKATRPQGSLDPLAWSYATLQEREHFLAEIGRARVLAAIPKSWNLAHYMHVLANEKFIAEFKRRLPLKLWRKHQAALKATCQALDPPGQPTGLTSEPAANPVSENEAINH